VPGSEYICNDVRDRDLIFELAKRLYGIDLNTSYTFRKTIDNLLTYATYTNIYDIGAAKELTDMVLLSTNYSHSNSYKDDRGNEGTTQREDYFNVNTALRLWAGANLSFGYSYENDTDWTGILSDTKTNTYSTTFSWPFSKYLLKTGAELTLAPYITYMLVEDWHKHSTDRTLWTMAMDATYKISKDHRISASAMYRDDDEDDPDVVTPAETNDYRFLLTYQKIFQ
jgi:hypothetical protein